MIVGRAFMITEKFMIGCLNKLKKSSKWKNIYRYFKLFFIAKKKSNKKRTDKTKNEFVAELMARMTVDEK
jgi:hypothetical protein